MTNLSRRKPFRNVAPHPTPRQMITLAATAQHRPPQITHCLVKSAQRWAVHRHTVVAEVTHQDRAQIRALFPNGRVHASPQLLVQGSQLGLPSLSHRLSQYREVSLPSFPATMRKTQEVERLRFAAAKLLSILFRKAAELDNARFVGMQLKAKPREPLAQFRQKPLCFMAMLEARDEVLGETHKDYFPTRLLLSPSLNPEVENIMEIDVRQQRANTTALHRPYLALHSPALFQHACLKPFRDKAHDAAVGYAFLKKLPQPSLTESVIKLADAGIEPPVPFSRSDPNRQCIQPLMRAAPRPETVRKFQEVLFINSV